MFTSLGGVVGKQHIGGRELNESSLSPVCAVTLKYARTRHLLAMVMCVQGPLSRAGWTRRRRNRSAPMVIVAGHITVEPQQRESYLMG
jgi:hypothetical protein